MIIIRKLVVLFLIVCSIIPQANAITLPRANNNNHLQSNKFIGKWDIQTIVTKSECPFILVGSTTESNLEIEPVFDLRGTKPTFNALWKGGNWTNSTSTIKLLNEKEAITERVTELTTSSSEKWKAVLIDHLKIQDNNSIHSESIVIQYKNGTIVGKYKTYSILTKSTDNIE